MLELAARLYGERNGARILHALLTYLFHVTPLDPETLRGLLTHPRPELEDAMLTAAQQLDERGHHEGKREGKLKGEAELLRRLLEHESGSLTPRHRRRLAEADEATLHVESAVAGRHDLGRRFSKDLPPPTVSVTQGVAGSGWTIQRPLDGSHG